MGTASVFTSESVSEGHPDKVADQISDALLDEFLAEDERIGVEPAERCHVAIETMLAHGVAVVSGEVTSKGYVNIMESVRKTIESIGYTDTRIGFDGANCGVLVAIQPQSPDIRQGVVTGGAGDQGMMFGMACNETPELMPLPISIAHALMRRSVEVRGNAERIGFRPDAKSQVTVAYEDGKPRRIDTVVVAQQHDEEISDTVIDLIER
ncbi:MAG: methionine adenosyltransferase, partial [Armatimonadetes bacterium]|nr:methionine adenosyltransferase [Armatimonadota bacterium]